jgi:rhodanese-related sulfurtransferase
MLKHLNLKNCRPLLAAICLFCLVSGGFTSIALAADEKPAAAHQDQLVKKVSVEEFDKLRSAKTNVVLDVRSAKEFQAGHIPNAVNIDVNSPDFDKKVAELDKSKTYLVHCAAGTRSAKACGKLETVGFKQLYDLPVGFRGWEKAGKPIEK